MARDVVGALAGGLVDRLLLVGVEGEVLTVRRRRLRETIVPMELGVRELDDGILVLTLGVVALDLRREQVLRLFGVGLVEGHARLRSARAPGATTRP